MKTRRLAREVLIVAILGAPLLPSAAEWAGSSAAADAKKYRAQATRSTPIAVTHDDDYVWSVNPDNDSVSVFKVSNDLNTKIAEVKVGKEPWCVAITPDDEKVYVTNMASGTVSVISTYEKRVVDTIRVEHRALRLRADSGRPQAVCGQPVIQHRFGDQHASRRSHRNNRQRRDQAARHRDQRRTARKSS